LDPLGVDWSYLLSVLVFGLAGGLLSGFLNGGVAWIKHNILRLLLWCRGCIPWSYPRFLDYAAEHILLRKVGGGYIFIHRLLLDYFASLEIPSPSESVQEDQTRQPEACQCGYQDDRIGMLFCPMCGKSKV